MFEYILESKEAEIMIQPGKAKLVVFDESDNQENIFYYDSFNEALQDMPQKIGLNSKVIVNYKEPSDDKLTCAKLEIRKFERFSWKDFFWNWWRK